MAYSLDDKLVIAIASSALFDLTESDRVYRERGVDEYRRFQREHEKDVLAPGVAFSLIKRLLALNGSAAADRVVEVILLSRNDPDTGLRVFTSIQHHGLEISRAVFVSGRDPFRYLGATILPRPCSKTKDWTSSYGASVNTRAPRIHLVPCIGFFSKSLSSRAESETAKPPTHYMNRASASRLSPLGTRLPTNVS